MPPPPSPRSLADRWEGGREETAGRGSAYQRRERHHVAEQPGFQGLGAQRLEGDGREWRDQLGSRAQRRIEQHLHICTRTLADHS